MKAKLNIFWFRRDLRWKDNRGLYEALQADYPVLCLFIFDKNILDDLEIKADRRVTFIHKTLTHLKQHLEKNGSSLLVKYGKPLDIWKALSENYTIQKVYTNKDYEPYAIKRDREVEELLAKSEIDFESYKDHVIFEEEEILKNDGLPYTVYTPYSRKWKLRFKEEGIKTFSSHTRLNKLIKSKPIEMITLEEMGFSYLDDYLPERKIKSSVIKKYDETRDIPSILGTSRLGMHLRFGTLSIRKLVVLAEKQNEKFLNELIWRDFYQMILWHFPHVVHSAFRSKYDHIPWRNNEKEFELWTEGKTGYPIVDAGMRELNETGYMHNRVRMIVASFLTKHLLIDWKWGEAYFAKHLIDFELASNNGGWQWAAGTGCDAAPYFRIFNPYIQTKKFDPDLLYIRKWVPELESHDYPPPIVDHKVARLRALDTYKAALEKYAIKEKSV